MMLSPIQRYLHGLHIQWPAGHVEKRPGIRPDGSTAVRGLYVVGDVAGIPLLKLSAYTGALAARTICNDPAFMRNAYGVAPAFKVARQAC